MKLHELLAVETNLENQANKVRSDLAGIFEKKRHLFEEKRVTFTPNGENQAPVTETQSDIQTSVVKELGWIQDHLVKALNASYQVAETNMTARADVVLEDDAGTVLLKAVPATALLELEKRMTELSGLMNAIPTLDPAKGFTLDSARGYFKAREVTKTRTRKEKKLFVKYEATKEHPAQTELLDQDVPVGTIQELEWSGLITPAAKAELINRVEMVNRAVRRARSRANDTEVDTSKKIGASSLTSFSHRRNNSGGWWARCPPLTQAQGDGSDSDSSSGFHPRLKRPKQEDSISVMLFKPAAGVQIPLGQPFFILLPDGVAVAHRN